MKQTRRNARCKAPRQPPGLLLSHQHVVAARHKQQQCRKCHAWASCCCCGCAINSTVIASAARRPSSVASRITSSRRVQHPWHCCHECMGLHVVDRDPWQLVLGGNLQGMTHAHLHRGQGSDNARAVGTCCYDEQREAALLMSHSVGAQRHSPLCTHTQTHTNALAISEAPQAWDHSVKQHVAKGALSATISPSPEESSPTRAVT